MASKVQIMADGKIVADKLPTVEFSLAADPASPEVGRIWWNETTHALKVADTSGVYAFTGGPLTAWDTTPAAFSFTDVSDATRGDLYISNEITVDGINRASAISITGDTGSAFSINGGAYQSDSTTVINGDKVRVSVYASTDYEVAKGTTLTIGGVSDTFTVETAVDPGGALTDAFIGWSNTAGTPDTNPGSTYARPNLMLTRKWTAPADGTLKTVNVYVGAFSGTIYLRKVCVYKVIAGTITLVASADYTTTQNRWIGPVTLVAEPGQSLDFVAGDELFYGAAHSGQYNIALGRETSGGIGSHRVTSAYDFTSGLPGTLTLTFTANENVAAILGVLI